MRILISVDGSWNVTIRLEQPVGGTLPWEVTRVMNRRPFVSPKGKVDYPFPAAAVEGAWGEGEEEKIDLAYRNISRGIPDNDDMTRFGTHLFQSLIGVEVWEKILASAGAEKVIELTLSWDKGDRNLHRLQWEMMCVNGRFLADAREKLVAITRRVEGTTAPARSVDAPARVLFVVCVPLYNPQIRPGAELLGLLRNFRERKARFGIQTRILLGAEPKTRGVTPEELRKGVQRFRPDVVHFVGHGRFNAAECHGVIDMARDPNEGLGGPIGRDASFLVDRLKVDGILPAIVVLAACETGGMGPNLEPPRLLTTGEAAPLAAELIEKGVPIVVGMSGRVSDMACRAFTRTFGLSLIENKPLALATALGRATAFSEAGKAAKSVHWAFPVVFLSAKVESGFVPLKARSAGANGEAGDWAARAEQRIGDFNFNLDRDPVFCGREEFFDDFDRLFEGEPVVLGVYAKAAGIGIGRTRLLREMLGQAIRDGHIPCHFQFDTSSESMSKAPSTIGELTLKLLEAIGGTRRIFNLPPPLDSLIFKAFRDVGVYQEDPDISENDVSALWDRFEDLLERCRKHAGTVITAGRARTLLQREFVSLTREARNADPRIASMNGRAVVFLDNIHRLPRDVLLDLIGEVLGSGKCYGFGPSTEERVPVVFTFVMSGEDAKNEPWKTVLEHPAIRYRELLPFSKEEHVFAYSRVLLFPHVQDRPILRDVSTRPWAVNDGLAPGWQTSVQQAFYLATSKGVPKMFKDPTFYEVVEENRVKTRGDEKYLVPAEEEQVLEKLIEVWNP